MKFLVVYLISFIIFLVIDFIWLGAIANKFYRDNISYLASNFKFLPAIIFYILLVIGINYFVILPAIETHSITKLIIASILFGLVTYATYDLTSYATASGFPLRVVIVDLIWGVFITTAVSTATYLIAVEFLKY